MTPEEEMRLYLPEQWQAMIRADLSGHLNMHIMQSYAKLISHSWMKQQITGYMIEHWVIVPRALLETLVNGEQPE